MNNHFYKKASLPRQAKNASSLKESLSEWADKRLLNVVSANENSNQDKYRVDYSNSHKRYAEMIKIVVDYVPDSWDQVRPAANRILSNLEIEFNSPMSSGQKDAAGICGAELKKIIEIFNIEE
tara:strand:+ start:281 stop:649 length:369 start_codon:yes stop_codon:yes gene_type:complete